MSTQLRSIPCLLLLSVGLLVCSAAMLAPQPAEAQNCLHCPGLAPDFEGNNVGAQNGSNEDFSNQENRQLTTEFWFKADAVENVTQMIWEQGQDFDGLNFYIHNGTFYAGQWSNNGTFNNHWISTDQVTSGTWHHVVWVYDFKGSADRTALYFDGELVGTDSPTYQMIQYNGDHGLGGVNGSTNSHTDPPGGDNGDLSFSNFTGRIDQLRVWRGAFSQEEVRSRRQRRLWNAEFDPGSGLVGPNTDTLDLHYPFNLSGSEGNPGWGYVGVSGRGIADGSFTSSSDGGIFESSSYPLTTNYLDATSGSLSGENANGVDGGTVTVDNMSSGEMLLSYHGSSSGSPIDVSSSAAVTRLNLAWVLDPKNDTQLSPDVTFDYTSAGGVGDVATPVLLKRTDPDEAWAQASGWTHDPSNDTFTKDGITVNGFAEYAVGRPFVVVNDDDGAESFGPCDTSPDESTVSNGLGRVPTGETVYVCTGSYNETTLDVQENVTLLSNADVTVPDELTLSSGTFDVSSGSLTLESTGESSSARISGSGSGTISGDVTVERYIEYDDGQADGSHWRMMASPLGGALDEVSGGGGGEHDTYSGAPLLSNMWTQGITGANYQSGASPSVFYYDETASVTNASDGWAAVGDLTNPTGGGNIESQEGFAAYLFQDRDFDDNDEGFPVTLSATGSVAATENDGSDVTLPVTCTDNDGTGSDGCTDDFDGWNLVANPFVSHVEWNSGGFTTSVLESNAYVYDADNGHYDQTDGTNGGDVFIAPFQAFFVKSNAGDGSEGSASLLVNSGAKADRSNSDDREFKSVDAEPLISLQLSDGDHAEETRVTFRDGAEAGKDRFDGYQLTPLSADYHVLASEIDERGGTYDSQYRPMPSEDSLTIDLAVTTTSGGTYTIEADTLAALPTDLQVKVVDTQTGEVANLKAGESLTFTVESSQAAPSEKTSPRELLADGGPVQKASASGVMADRFDLQIIPAAAIPVELASFDATACDGEVDLKWQTASETGNAGFAVQRRIGGAQGGSWTQVSFLEGAGTTDQPKTYRFTDTEVPFETEQVTYRLRQKDLDGTTTLSDEVTAQLGTPSEARLHAPFPNPAAQRVTVRYEVPTSTSAEIAVYDVLGRRVETVVDGQVPEGREQTAVQTGHLSPGVYFVRMRVGDAVQTERLTIVR